MSRKPSEEIALRKSDTKPKNGDGATLGFEAKLWQIADKLRNNMYAAEYIRNVIQPKLLSGKIQFYANSKMVSI